MKWTSLIFGCFGFFLTWIIVKSYKSKTPLEIFLDRALLAIVIILLLTMGVLWWVHSNLSAFEFVHTYPELSDAANYAVAGLIMGLGWD